jgi:flagellar assembly protein FliH
MPSWRQVSSGGLNPTAPADAPAAFAHLQQECEKRASDARLAGFRDGESSGRAKAAAEQQPILDRLARSIEEVAHLRPKMRREAESDMIRLALAIARRVLRRELSIDSDAMHGLVLGALEKLASQELHRVRVHPSQVPQVTGWLRQALTGVSVDVVGDPSCEPGAILFETTRGNLDASVDCQLQEIERGLIDRLNRPS